MPIPRSSCVEYEDPYHDFSMNTGNAMYGVVLPHVAGWLRQDVSPNVNDAPFIFRYGVLLTNAAFDAVAPYHRRLLAHRAL